MQIPKQTVCLILLFLALPFIALAEHPLRWQGSLGYRYPVKLAPQGKNTWTARTKKSVVTYITGSAMQKHKSANAVLRLVAENKATPYRWTVNGSKEAARVDFGAGEAAVCFKDSVIGSYAVVLITKAGEQGAREAESFMASLRNDPLDYARGVASRAKAQTNQRLVAPDGTWSVALAGFVPEKLAGYRPPVTAAYLLRHKQKDLQFNIFEFRTGMTSAKAHVEKLMALNQATVDWSQDGTRTGAWIGRAKLGSTPLEFYLYPLPGGRVVEFQSSWKPGQETEAKAASRSMRESLKTK